MNLRCKFRVVDVAKHATPTPSGCRVLKLEATNSTAGDNEDWSKYTPNGTFEICVTNEAAFATIDAMSKGDLFWLDLSPLSEAKAIAA